MNQNQATWKVAAGRRMELVAKFSREESDLHRSPEHILRQGAEICMHSLDAAAGYFATAGPNNDRLLVKFIGSVLEDSTNLEVGVHDPLFGNATRQQEPSIVVFEQAGDAPIERNLVSRGLSLLMKTPIYLQDRLFGTVGAILPEVREIEDEEHDCLGILSQLIGMKHEIAARQSPTERIESFGSISTDDKKASEPEERRTHRRDRFWFVQYIAPIRDSRRLTLKEFVPVECRDISESGLSFLSSRAPDFEKLLVALGRPPAFVHCLAEVVRTERVRTDRGPRMLVGCRFLQRVAF